MSFVEDILDQFKKKYIIVLCTVEVEKNVSKKIKLGNVVKIKNVDFEQKEFLCSVVFYTKKGQELCDMSIQEKYFEKDIMFNDSDDTQCLLIKKDFSNAPSELLPVKYHERIQASFSSNSRNPNEEKKRKRSSGNNESVTKKRKVHNNDEEKEPKIFGSFDDNEVIDDEDVQTYINMSTEKQISKETDNTKALFERIRILEEANKSLMNERINVVEQTRHQTEIKIINPNTSNANEHQNIKYGIFPYSDKGWHMRNDDEVKKYLDPHNMVGITAYLNNTQDIESGKNNGRKAKNEKNGKTGKNGNKGQLVTSSKTNRKKNVMCCLYKAIRYPCMSKQLRNYFGHDKYISNNARFVHIQNFCPLRYRNMSSTKALKELQSFALCGECKDQYGKNEKYISIESRCTICSICKVKHDGCRSISSSSCVKACPNCATHKTFIELLVTSLDILKSMFPNFTISKEQRTIVKSDKGKKSSHLLADYIVRYTTSDGVLGIIVIEVDEDQHKSYNKEYEVNKMVHQSTDYINREKGLGHTNIGDEKLKILFIRYSPYGAFSVRTNRKSASNLVEGDLPPVARTLILRQWILWFMINIHKVRSFLCFYMFYDMKNLEMKFPTEMQFKCFLYQAPKPPSFSDWLYCADPSESFTQRQLSSLAKTTQPLQPYKSSSTEPLDYMIYRERVDMDEVNPNWSMSAEDPTRKYPLLIENELDNMRNTLPRK